MIIDKEKIVGGLKLWETNEGPVKELLPVCRLAAAKSRFSLIQMKVG